MHPDAAVSFSIASAWAIAGHFWYIRAGSNMPLGGLPGRNLDGHLSAEKDGVYEL